VTTLEKTVHPSMTTLTFKSESGNKNFSDGLAKLWLTDDLTGILHLGMLYEIHSYQESEIAPGLNYFISDPKTPEWMIKHIAWQRPEDCFVHGLSQPVEIFIDEVVSARELGRQILDAQSFKEWATRKDSENLTVKEALQIAKVALTRLSGKLTPDNQSNLDVCHISETLDNQESQPLCLTDSYFQEGGGVNDSVRQVENITQSEDTTIGVEPEPIKVGDKVFVLHPQANENGDTVHEIGDGWVTVDFLTKQFPIGEVVKM